MSEITLENIDAIRQRTNLSYKESKELLERHNGDVIEALIEFEESNKSNDKEINEDDFKKSNFADDVALSMEEFVNYIKELVKKGNVARIKIKKDDNVILDVPVNAGIVIGIVALLQPLLIIIGTAAALIVKVQIEITKTDGTVEVVNKIVKSTMDTAKNKVNDVAEGIKEKVNIKKSDNVNEDNEINSFSYKIVKDDEEDEESNKED